MNTAESHVRITVHCKTSVTVANRQKVSKTLCLFGKIISYFTIICHVFNETYPLFLTLFISCQINVISFFLSFHTSVQAIRNNRYKKPRM
jgi:hypothetical protein